MSNTSQPTISTVPDTALGPILFKHGPFSSFHLATIVLPCPYTGAEREFASNEHFFHADKVAVYYKRLGDLPGYLRVANAPTPAAAKSLGGPRHTPLPDDLRARWDHGRSFFAMLTANRAKFAQHRDLRQTLLATGSRLLIEHRPDPIWGDNLDGTGRNWLGLVLMLVREEHR